MSEEKKFDLSEDVKQKAEIAETQTIDVDGVQMIAELSTASVSYCSMHLNDINDKLTAYNATSNTGHSLSEMIGEEFLLRHVYVEAIQCVNEQTGEVNTCPRIVLISPTGESYQAVSMGIYGSMRKIFQLFGDPSTWTFALRCVCKRVKTRRGFYTNTIEILGVEEI